MKKDNINYKKITVEILSQLYTRMKVYCSSYNNHRSVYYKDLISRAIEKYLDNKI